MKNKNLFTIVSLIFSVCVLGILVWAAEPKCQKPNPSTGACADPTAGTGRQKVEDCATNSYPNCLGISQYTINMDWPKGTISVDSGVTTETWQNCYQETYCTEPNHPLYIGKPCVVGVTNGWVQKAKTIVDTNPATPCPDE
jgi:hypothetical protein